MVESMSHQMGRLLLGIDMSEESNRKDWDGPVPALWSFDLDSQQAVRITPKKLFGWDGCWVDNDNILFLSRAPGEKNDSIYRMSADGKNLKRRSRRGISRLSARPNLHLWNCSLSLSSFASHVLRRAMRRSANSRMNISIASSLLTPMART